MRTFAGMPAVAMLLVTGALQAQQPGRFGIGVSLNPAAIVDPDDGLFLPIGLGNIYVPVQLGRSVRLEPEIGVFWAKQESSGGGFSFSETSTVMRLGIGVFYLFPADHGFRAYIGPRAGMIRTSDKQESTGNPSIEIKRTDKFLGLALGGEYFLSNRFSLGGEAQINRISIGDEETDPPQPSSGESSQTLITNNGLIFVRWYFR